MKVLITGHKGFVGRYFWEHLDKDGHNLIGVDIKDGFDCRDYFKENDIQFDLVIHLAAIVGGRENIEGRPLAVADNFSIDSEFFQWCLKTKPKKVVYFSSSAAYPTWMQTEHYRDFKLLESDINFRYIDGGPDMTYGWSKLVGEYLASFVENVYIFRPFSGYGTDQDLNYPFPKYIERAKNKENPFEVWGSGKQTRDFIHIEDIVNAVMTAVENDIKGPINLGWGRATSFLDLAEMVTYYAGYKAEIVTRPDKPVGCMHRVADATKMWEFYKPKITLEEGIERAMRGER
jgi:nucleoside-diphosphate-sugar epimerase